MVKKILASVFAFVFIIPCMFIFTACGNKGEVFQGRVSNVEADSVTNYWIEYQQYYSHNPLRTVAKATKDGVTYYYLEYGNNGNWNYKFVKLDANGHYKVWNWGYYENAWIPVNSEVHPECGEGDDWFMWKTQFYSDYFSMALVALQYTGEVNSLIRKENGTEVKDMGLSDWNTEGYTCGYNHTEHEIAQEIIHDCLYFYDEQEDSHYFFAPDTHFLLSYQSSYSTYNRTTKVYKRSFDMNTVLAVHDMNTNGLPFELPEV